MKSQENHSVDEYKDYLQICFHFQCISDTQLSFQDRLQVPGLFQRGCGVFFLDTSKSYLKTSMGTLLCVSLSKSWTKWTQRSLSDHRDSAISIPFSGVHYQGLSCAGGSILSLHTPQKGNPMMARSTEQIPQLLHFFRFRCECYGFCLHGSSCTFLQSQLKSIKE